MSKAKSGTGKGTDKKGWNRWQASANRAKNSPKPYTSKGVKRAEELKKAEEAKIASEARIADAAQKAKDAKKADAAKKEQ